MKSIMEEASSIAKAIEKGWDRAGKPQEFTVKVFEEAQKNFLGLTTKPAKIGLFFQEAAVTQPTGRQTRPEKSHSQSPRKTGYQEQPSRQNNRSENPSATHGRHERDIQIRPERSQQPKAENTRGENQSSKKEHLSTSPWNPDLVASAQEWVNQSLQTLGLKSLDCTVEVDRYALKFQFSKLITENSEREKILFRSWAYLIMQALRQKYKRPLKGLKVILMSNA